MSVLSVGFSTFKAAQVFHRTLCPTALHITHVFVLLAMLSLGADT